MSFEDPDLTFMIEANDDDTEIRLVVSSPSGRKIEAHEFIMQIEQWLHEVTQAEIQRNQIGGLLN